MTTTEEHLGRFYIELQAWIDGGCGAHNVFRRQQPICDQLLDWEDRYPDAEGIWRLARDQIKDAGLSSYCPFDEDEDAFDMAMGQGTLYTNSARLAWIKEHAEAAKAAGLAVTA